jgi:hypothetical protein
MAVGISHVTRLRARATRSADSKVRPGYEHLQQRHDPYLHDHAGCQIRLLRVHMYMQNILCTHLPARLGFELYSNV